MLHAQHTHPGTFDALFLQSGSFFTPRYDAQESRFPRYAAIVAFVRDAARRRHRPRPHRAHLRHGRGEPGEQRAMAATLAAWATSALLDLPDTHNYTAWRDALHPHLTRLVADAW